jgi:UDP-N-acetylglucosamine 4,6-dehydratase/5-epimerase
MLDLNHKTVLITGGTGSFGQKFVQTVLERYPDIGKLIVFSRDELKQYEMSIKFPPSKHKALRYFLGDIRDKDRLYRAFEGVDMVVHAAALKQVPAAEYNPFEFIKTNIIGAENIVNAALDKGVNNIVALSTDKAAAPINLYGATKLCSDKLFVAANNMKGKRDCKFTIVRYGNVMGSRGSVVPFFMEKRKEGVLPITDPEMTRFNILLEEGIDLVLHALEKGMGGEIFVPKIPSFKITDMAKAIGPDCRIEIVGIRPGEKVHEEMITSSDSYTTVDTGKYYAILPQSQPWRSVHYFNNTNVQPVPKGFRYNSGENTEWLNVEQLRSLIKNHLYPDFTV